MWFWIILAVIILFLLWLIFKPRHKRRYVNRNHSSDSDWDFAGGFIDCVSDAFDD